MGDVIVVSGATHRSGMLDLLESQLERAGVPFHLEPIEAMPNGPNSMTMRRKIDFVRRMAWSMEPFYRRIFIVDAFDVQFFGTKQDLMNWDFPVMFAAERNAYPEADLEGRIKGLTPWKYANAGCMAGSPAHLYLWAQRCSLEQDLDILDQAWLNRHLLTRFCPVDELTRLFYVVSQAAEDGSLQIKNGRPYNARCRTFPPFLHFSGKCPADNFNAMMEAAK